MSLSNPLNKAFRYGPSVVKLYFAVLFFVGCAVAAYFLGKGDPKQGLVILASLGMVAAGAYAIYRQSKPRHILFTSPSVFVPAGLFSSKIVEIRYEDLLGVQIETSPENLMRVNHSAGHVDIPYRLLAHVNIDELHKEFLTRRKTGVRSPAIPSL